MTVRQTGEGWVPLWSLRADAGEAAALARLLPETPVRVGSAAWWAAVDGGAVPSRETEGVVVRGEGRPGEAEGVLVIRGADGAETAHRIGAALREPSRLVGRTARVTEVRLPGRAVPVLIEVREGRRINPGVPPG